MHSDMFTLVVGPENSEFRVHTAALTSKSDVFDRMIKSGMQEATTKTLKIDSLDEEDVVRLSEFLYTGNYAEPEYTKRERQECTSLSNVVAATMGVASITRSFALHCDECLGQVEYPRRDILCETCDYDVSVECDSIYLDSVLGDDASAGRSSATEFGSGSSNIVDKSPALMAHARLYVFADKYAMPRLKIVTFDKILSVLIGLTFDDDACVEGLVDLLRYIFSDDSTPDLCPGVEPLRQLLIEFVISKVHIVGTTTAFMDMLMDGKAFARDLWLMLLNATGVTRGKA